MANWESLRLTDVIEKIQKNEIVLPVIQRNLVWKEEKIELLFDTLLKGDSFGGIMTLRDSRDNKPLFDFRYFVREFKDKSYLRSNGAEKLTQDIAYVIDGQQRLQPAVPVSPNKARLIKNRRTTGLLQASLASI